jgi:Skp family chaperone for outer membrane proteins
VRAREAALAKDMAALEGQYVQLQRDLSAEEQRRARPIREHLRVILRRLAQSRGIETVAEQPPVVAGDPAYVDLTDDVIRAAEAQ